MSKIKISAVVNTRNEEKNIDTCLKSLNFVDEIVVVDMESEDKTKQIAKKYTDKVFDYEKIDYVEPARNFAISKAKGEWILIVDADERIPRSLAVKLMEIAEDNQADFVRIPRQNIIFSQWIKHSRWWPDYIIRFFKKGRVEWQDAIHSIPITSGKGINLPEEKEFSFTHHHYTSIEQYLNRSLRYSRQQAKELLESGYTLDARDMFFKPIGEFLGRFFAGEGYKDGLHGLVLSLLQAFSVFSVYLFVWEKQGFKVKRFPSFTRHWIFWFRQAGSDIRYWVYTVKIHTAKNKTHRFFLKIARKLKL